MATTAQITANRLNAQNSTGPRTDQGKQRSAANSTRHGLASGFTVLPHENQQEFDGLREQYTREFAPQSTHEEFLVNEMSHARWRTTRIHRLENCLLAGLCGEATCPHDQAILDGMKKLCADLPAALARYAAAAERFYYKAHKELLAARELRTRHEEIRVRNEANMRQTAIYDYIVNPGIPREWTANRPSTAKAQPAVAPQAG